jgi:hypothetical protein
MIAQIYESLYKRLKELPWLKHVAMNYNQLDNPEGSKPWNTPAIFISFETADISLLSANVYNTTSNITFRFVMKDFSNTQLITLKYVEFIKRKLNGFMGLHLIDYNYYIDQDVNYVMDIVFQITCTEDLTNTEESIEAIFEQVNLSLQEVDSFDDISPEGFASAGMDLVILPEPDPEI